VVEELADIGRAHNVTYTVHLPTDRKAGAESKTERRGLVDQVLRLRDLMEPLAPYAYILHLEGLSKNPEQHELREWKSRTREVCRAIAESMGSAAAEVCVENLAYPPELHMGIVRESGFSVCADVGHLWLHGPETWDRTLQEMLGMTSVIHLHGINEVKDHISLKDSNLHILRRFVDVVRDSFSGVLTLEVFNEGDLVGSLEALEGVWHRSV
jgi:sugar phosphate isomerase/epimerase